MTIPTIVVKDGNGASQTINTTPNGGQTTGANSLPVIVASDQSAIPVTPSQPIGGTYTDRSIASMSGSSQQLMAANASRKILIIQNIAAANIGVNLTGGTAAIGTAGTVTIVPGGNLILDQYPPTSIITVIGTSTQSVTAMEG